MPPAKFPDTAWNGTIVCQVFDDTLARKATRRQDLQFGGAERSAADLAARASLFNIRDEMMEQA